MGAAVGAFGVNMRALLPFADVVIGTEEEFFAALSGDPGLVFGGGRLGDDERRELMGIMERLLDEANTSVTALVVKRGARGASLLSRQAPALDVAGYAVEVVNTVGAGDAFAGGLIFGRMQGGIGRRVCGWAMRAGRWSSRGTGVRRRCRTATKLMHLTRH